MALREIGARLTLEGEQEWNRQMKAADRELANLKSELAATSAEFYGQANTIEALRAKQQVQTRQTEQQRERVRALAQAVEDATKMWGEDSQQVDKYTQKLNYARASLANMERGLDETNGYLEEAEAAADGCATSIDGFGRKVKDAGAKASKASDGVEELGEAEEGAAGGAGKLLAGLQKMVPGLSAANIAATFSAAGIAKAFKAAWDWAMNLVDSTAELRQRMTSLEIAAQAAGRSVDEDMTSALRLAYEASGDMETAYKTVAELLQAGYSNTGMVAALEELRGAIIAFPDTVKIDSLVEGLQKTLSTGSADGQFKDLLERLGVDANTFAEGLAACTTEAQKQDYIMQTLAASGLSDMTQAFLDASESSIALSDAQFDLEQANARLAESLEPLKVKAVETEAAFAEAMTELLRFNQLGGSGDVANSLLRTVNKTGAGMSMDDLLSTLETAGLTFGTVKGAAREAGQSVGEFINQLHADQVAEAAVANEKLAEKEQLAADAAEDEAAAQKKAQEALEADMGAVDDALATLERLRAQYDAIRAGIDSTVDGFTNLNKARDETKKSLSEDGDIFDNMISGLNSQIGFLENYENLLQQAADMGLSDALIEELSDGSMESRVQLEAIVNAGEENIQALNAKFAEVEQGKQQFVETVAAMLPEFQAELDEATGILESAVDDWNLYTPAYENASNTIQGYLDAIYARTAEVQAAMAALAEAGAGGYTGAMDQHSPSRRAYKDARFTVKGYLNAYSDSMEEMKAMGGDMGETFLEGYRRTQTAAASLMRAETPGTYAGAASGAAGASDDGVKALLLEYLPKLAGMQVRLQDGTLVGALTSRIDDALGDRRRLAERGLAL